MQKNEFKKENWMKLKKERNTEDINIEREKEGKKEGTAWKSWERIKWRKESKKEKMKTQKLEIGYEKIKTWIKKKEKWQE